MPSAVTPFLSAVIVADPIPTAVRTGGSESDRATTPSSLLDHTACPTGTPDFVAKRQRRDFRNHHRARHRRQVRAPPLRPHASPRSLPRHCVRLRRSREGRCRCVRVAGGRCNAPTRRRFEPGRRCTRTSTIPEARSVATPTTSTTSASIADWSAGSSDRQRGRVEIEVHRYGYRSPGFRLDQLPCPRSAWAPSVATVTGAEHDTTATSSAH